MVLFWLAAGVRAEPACPSVQVGNPDGNYVVPGVWGDIPYQTHEGLQLSLDAYIQRASKPRPGVLVVHGGEWAAGSRVSFVGQFLELLTEAGFNWFSVDYRKGPNHPYPAALNDLRSALAFIRCNAERFHLEPDRIVLMGENSGAHLAAMLASEKPPGVRALVTFGAPFDLTEWQRLHDNPQLRRYFGLDQDSPALNLPCEPGLLPAQCRLRLASPIYAITGKSPAVLALHGTEDVEVPLSQSELFCRRVRDLGGRCDVFPVEGAIHRPENWTPSQWGYKPRLVDWLYHTLGIEALDHQPYPHAKLRKDIVYGRTPAEEGDSLDLKLDAYVPDTPGPHAGVILVHGGGWEAGDKVTYLAPLLEPLAHAGFVWFSIDYRLTPQVPHTAQLEDLRRAIRFIRHHASEFKLDPGRIGLLGESASGQMALLLASEACPGKPEASDPVEREDCEVQALISFYGVYDFLPMVKDASPRSLLVRLFGINQLDDDARQVLRRFSPLYRVHSDMPPILLIHGTDELLWDQALQLERRLAELGADYELIALEGAPHGMENWEGRPQWEHYKQRLVQWLLRKL